MSTCCSMCVDLMFTNSRVPSHDSWLMSKVSKWHNLYSNARAWNTSLGDINYPRPLRTTLARWIGLQQPRKEKGTFVCNMSGKTTRSPHGESMNDAVTQQQSDSPLNFRLKLSKLSEAICKSETPFSLIFCARSTFKVSLMLSIRVERTFLSSAAFWPSKASRGFAWMTQGC